MDSSPPPGPLGPPPPGTTTIPSSIMYCMPRANSRSLILPSAHHRALSLIQPGMTTAPASFPAPTLSITIGISALASAAPPRFSNRKTTGPPMPAGTLAANVAPVPSEASVAPEADAITAPLSSCTSDTSYSADTGLSLRNTSVMLNPNSTSPPDLTYHGSHPTDTLNCPFSAVAPSGARSPASSSNLISPPWPPAAPSWLCLPSR